MVFITNELGKVININKLTLGDMLKKIAVDKQYEYINNIMELPVMKGIIFNQISGYPKFHREEAKAIAEAEVKMMLLREWKNHTAGYSEAQFMTFLQTRLPRIYDTIQYEIFHKKKTNKNSRKPEDGENNDIPEEAYEEDNLDMANEEYRINHGVLDDSTKSEQRMEIESALEQLNPIEREIIEMKFYSNLSDEEIGEYLHMPRETVRDTRVRALDKMKNFLK
jgi:RNA polymerase sigma factor (sigma-70 family)